MEVKNIVLNAERNVKLTAYLQEVEGEFAGIGRRPAIMILPGGGYSMCSDREADPVTFPYLKAGYQAFILRYSVGKHAVWPAPLNDYEEAMAMIRRNADEWHVLEDKIAVIGFSAGGHLAACAATMSVNRPNAAILGYPVIEGETARVWQETAPDVIGAVDYTTCPCFVFATRTDNVVPVQNSVHFIDALVKNEIAFESHIYSNGPHGFSTCDSSVQVESGQLCNRVPHWVGDSIEWLKDIFGDFGPAGMKPPRFGSKLNGNHDETLNIDCTIGYLMTKPSVAGMLENMLKTGESAEQDQKSEGMAKEMDSSTMQMLVRNMTLRQTLEFGNVPEEALKQIDDQLRKIGNR